MSATIVVRKSRAECAARGFANLEALYDTDRDRYRRMWDAGLVSHVYAVLLREVHGDTGKADRLIVDARNLRTVRIDYACGHSCVRVAPVSAIESSPGFYRRGVTARCGVCAAVPEASRDAYWQVITRVTLDGHALAWDTLRLSCGHSVLRERRTDRPWLDGCLGAVCGSCGVSRDVVGTSTVESVSVAA